MDATKWKECPVYVNLTMPDGTVMRYVDEARVPDVDEVCNEDALAVDVVPRVTSEADSRALAALDAEVLLDALFSRIGGLREAYAEQAVKPAPNGEPDAVDVVAKGLVNLAEVLLAYRAKVGGKMQSIPDAIAGYLTEARAALIATGAAPPEPPSLAEVIRAEVAKRGPLVWDVFSAASRELFRHSPDAPTSAQIAGWRELARSFIAAQSAVEEAIL